MRIIWEVSKTKTQLQSTPNELTWKHSRPKAPVLQSFIKDTIEGEATVEVPLALLYSLQRFQIIVSSPHNGAQVRALSSRFPMVSTHYDQMFRHSRSKKNSCKTGKLIKIIIQRIASTAQIKSCSLVTTPKGITAVSVLYLCVPHTH